MPRGDNDDLAASNVVRAFRPHWRVLLAAMLWADLAAVLIVVIVVKIDGNARWWLIGGVAAVLLALTMRDVIAWFSTRYTLTTDQIIVKTGVLKITKIKIPLESIDNITMTRNLLERMLGYGDMVIESTQGSSTFADIPDPEEFEAELLRHRDARRGQSSATGAPSAAGRDAIQRLAELADLHERGAVSDAEFESKKRQLLDEI